MAIKQWRWSVRAKALDAYGGRCTCCDESDPAFLVFDHVEGGGGEHRKQDKIVGGNGLAVWLYRHGFPEGFQVLCANCNMAKEQPHGCPHQKEME